MERKENNYGEDNDMLTVRDVARACGRTEETVRRWIWSGKLRAQKLGNQLFVAPGDVMAMKTPRVAEAVATYAPTKGTQAMLFEPVRYDSAEALALLDDAAVFGRRMRDKYGCFDAGDLVHESREGH